MNQGTYSLKCSLELGDEIAEARQHLVADAVPVGDTPFDDDLPDKWVEAFAVALEAQVERHVIDPGAEVVDLVYRDIDVVGKLLGGALNAVA